MSLGNKIREIRKNNNLTQEQFAQKFHVTRQTVSNWENDKNYPDLSSLKEISNEYGISFDELFKGDEKYIKTVDDTKRKMSLFKKALIGSLIILGVVVAGFFVILHMAFQPTPDGKRINTDTTIRMLVDLPDATPSRAITFTTDKTNDDSSYERTLEKYKTNVLGGVEGDIPCVILEDNPKIALRFQDLYYNNLFPNDIKKVSADLINVLSDYENKVTVDLKYIVENGNIIIDPVQINYDKGTQNGEVWYKMSIVVEYVYDGQTYTSVTAVTVFDTSDIR